MLAIIPARGGSKGLPRKNIKELLGKPLIAYTIEAAINSRNVSRVIVTTDCTEIAKISAQYGAEVPFMRPPEFATDTAKAIDVYTNLLDRLDRPDKAKQIIDSCIVLLPTCPLRESIDIDNAIDLYYENNADSVVSYTEENHPVKWHKYISEDGKFKNIFPETINNRQQERVSYYPNGAIYVFRRSLINSGRYYSKNSYAYMMPNNRSVDIDTIDDFDYAEYLMGR